MASGEATTGAVSYREADTPVALPGLAVVGVKLLGLYALVHALPQVVSMPLYLWSPEYRGLYGLLAMLPIAAYVVIGVVLLWHAEWVVRRVARIPVGEAPPMTLNEHFQGVAFSIVGVVLAAWGLADAAVYVADVAYVQANRNAGAVMSDVGYARLVEPLVEMSGGIVLFLRGRGLAALWHRMRHGGVRVRPAE